MWLQQLIRWFLPEEHKFFDFIEQAADSSDRAAHLMEELLSTNPRDSRPQIIERIRDAEHAGDKAMKDMADALDATFVTPLDREDLYHITNKLESVSDLISATANHVSVHQMDTLPEGSRELAAILVKCTTQFREAAHMLRDHKNADKIRQTSRALHYLEHEADVIFRMRIADLFAREKDAIQLIKHKEFLEGLEDAVDHCAHVGTAMEAMLIKNG
ncbi:MAG: DUF47 family protein [Planctomycetes bacterium]|nr:DUF47 family protein [Planctomycetota bacterium]